MKKNDIIDLIQKKLGEYKNRSERVVTYLKDIGVWDQIKLDDKSDAESLYLYCGKNSKECPEGNLRFVSFSVGYRYCSPKCDCCILSKKSKVSESKNALSNEEKEIISSKRKNTNIKKYGVENVFQMTDLVKKSMIKKHGVDNPMKSEKIKDHARKTNLDRYGVPNVMQNKIIKDKIKHTNLAKYGTENPLGCKKIQNSVRNTLIEKYGVDNPMKFSDIADKAKQTCIKRYGYENPFLDSDIQKSIRKKQKTVFYNSLQDRLGGKLMPKFNESEYMGSAQYYEWLCKDCGESVKGRIINGTTPRCYSCDPITVSVFQKEVVEFIKSHGYTTLINNRSLIPPLEIDIFLPEKNIAIECNGNYWHSEQAGGKDIYYHVNKSKKLLESRIKLIHVLESEWIYQQEIVKSRILSMLGLTEKIHARKCSIIEVPTKVKAEFMAKNHIQGDCPSSINFGLLYDNRVVAMMTFGKSRYNKNHEYELLRFASELNSTVIGGASKLLKHFVTSNNPKSIISYCDLRWSTGNMYNKIGFVFSHVSPPSYKYFHVSNPKKLFNRQVFQKHKLPKILDEFDGNLTEWENMKNNNYDRIWDCGNNVYIWSSENST